MIEEEQVRDSLFLIYKRLLEHGRAERAYSDPAEKRERH